MKNDLQVSQLSETSAFYRSLLFLFSFTLLGFILVDPFCLSVSLSLSLSLAISVLFSFRHSHYHHLFTLTTKNKLSANTFPEQGSGCIRKLMKRKNKMEANNHIRDAHDTDMRK